MSAGAPSGLPWSLSSPLGWTNVDRRQAAPSPRPGAESIPGEDGKMSMVDWYVEGIEFGMGVDVCYTNHAEADQDDMDALLTLLTVAGVTFVIAVPGADDIMLNYQSHLAP
jgi:hypothetical protein